MKKISLTFLKGILAGLAIGLGGFTFILFTFLLDNEVGKVIGSFTFAIGLFLVCTFSLNLYTGKIGLIYEEKKDKRFFLDLLIMYVGNICGAVAIGYLCYFIFKDQDIFNRVKTVSSSRIVFNDFYDYLRCMVQSFLCGTCVYLAVRTYAFAKNKALGILLLVLFVFVFVYSSYQHCIANMFYLAFGNEYGNWQAYINILICTLFNSLGPILGYLVLKVFSKR